jgi:hypothetical protein
VIPAGLSKDELLAVIDDIRARIAANDSFEGHLTWSFPEQSGDIFAFDVTASYRVGNSMGQGGMRVIGKYDTTTGATQ